MAYSKNKPCKICKILIWDIPNSTGLCKKCWAKTRNFKHTEKTKEKLSGSNSPHWKGNDAGYHAKHYWVYRQLGKPNKCEFCGTEKAKRFEWANKSGKYKREIEDWVRLCSSCHHTYDKTIINVYKTKESL